MEADSVVRSKIDRDTAVLGSRVLDVARYKEGVYLDRKLRSALRGL